MAIVSAVIPTTGRSSLPAAIRSARAQDVDTEVVVVVDLPEDDGLRRLAGDADVVLFTGGRGGGAARNAGVAASSGEWVGFLDDDDEWLPAKSRIQLDAARRTGADVVASRVRQSFAGADADGGTVAAPVHLYRSGSVAEYLFRRRRPGHGRASLYTSSLLVRRSVAELVRWDENLRRHQDWDWLVRAVDRHAAALAQVPDVCVTISTGTPGSISRSTDWSSSLRWAGSALRPHSRALYADFVAAQPLRYACSGRSLAGARACLEAVLEARRLPTASSLAVGLAGLLPSGAFASLYRAVR